MSFANPAALWGLFLAIPILAVYLRKNRLRRESVSTLQFWDQTLEETAATSFFRRLKNPVALLIQLTLLVLMVLALSQPSVVTSRQHSELLVVIFDNSASMKAVDGAGTDRHQLALQECNRIVDSATGGTRISLVATCPVAHVVCSPTESRAVVLNRLSDIKRTDCQGSLNLAIRFAADTDWGVGDRSFVVVTDGNEDSSEAVVEVASEENASIGEHESENLSGRPASPDVRFIGSAVNNIGITKFRVRRSSEDPMAWDLLYEVGSFSNHEEHINLEIRRNRKILDVVPLQLAVNESQRGVLNYSSIEGGLLEARIRPETIEEEWSDGLDSDNQAMSMLADRRPLPVTLVTNGNWFLQQVLAANPRVRLTVARPNEWASAIQTSRSDSIVVFDAEVPPNWPPVDSGQPTRSVVIAPTKSSRFWGVDGMIDETFVGGYESEHPILQHAALEDIAINRATKIVPNQKSRTIVQSLEGSPLLATYETSDARMVMLAVHLDQSDLPLRSSFPILLTNVLRWLGGHDPEILPQATTHSATEIVVSQPGRLLPEASKWKWVRPDGSESHIAAASGRFPAGQFFQTGVHRLEWNSSQMPADSYLPSVAGRQLNSELLIPCNLESQQESRLNRVIPHRGGGQNLSGGSIWGSHNIGQWLILLLLVFLATECWLWNRRIVE